MARTKLTDGIVAGAQSPGRETVLWDASLPRFGVRISPQGGSTYMVQYRVKLPAGSKGRRFYIGRHDGKVWNLTKARAAAVKLLAAVDLGRDPFAERLAERRATHEADLAAQEAATAKARDGERKAQETVRALVDLYAKRRLEKRRSGVEAARLLRKGPVAAWGERHVSEIRRAEVNELLETIRARSAATARQTFAEMRTFFAWVADNELITVSPCASVKAPPRPAARDRVLKDAELRLVWRAAEGLGFPFGRIWQLLALTGQRLGEVAGMSWQELDLEAGLWRIPAARTKNKQAHEIDLSPLALEIIRAVPRVGPLLFPARSKTLKPVNGFSSTKRTLDKAIEALRASDAAEAGDDPPKQPLEVWRTHDLRRTAATGMSALGFAPHIIERVINHVSGTQGGLVGVYQRHDHRAARKEAAVAWGTRVAAILENRPLPSNVIPLRA